MYICAVKQIRILHRWLSMVALMAAFCMPPALAASSNSPAGKQLKQAISDTNQSFMRAWSQQNAQGVAQLYTQDAQLLAPGLAPLNGQQAVAAYIQGGMDAGLARISLETRELEQHGDTANEIGVYTLFTANDEVADKGKYIVIWKRRGGEWQLHRDMMNSSL